MSVDVSQQLLESSLRQGRRWAQRTEDNSVLVEQHPHRLVADGAGGLIAVGGGMQP